MASMSSWLLDAAGAGGGPAVSLVLVTDPSQSTTTGVIGGIVNAVVARVNQGDRPTAVGVQTETVQPQNLSAAAFFVPSILAMALKANPNILECLYSPMVEKVTELGAELIAARQGFLSQMIFQTFNGYAMSQFKKIEQDMRNHGEVRWKHAMHLLRLDFVSAVKRLQAAT